MTATPPVFDRRLGISGDEARRLFAPYTLQTLATEYWGTQVLHIKGTPGRYQGLLDLSRLFEVLDRGRSLIDNRPDQGEAFNIRASFDKLADVPRMNLQPEQVRAAFAAGATICINAINRADEGLDQFVRAIKTQLGYPGSVRFNCYYSPDGCGFGRHFDARVTTTLQLEGHKRWRYSVRPPVEWPLGNGALSPDGDEIYTGRSGAGQESWEELVAIGPGDYREVVLEPGDLLMLPAGCWHECSASGYSLALNLAFEREELATLVGWALRERFTHDVRWRSLPIAPRPVGQMFPDTEQIARHIRDRLEDLEKMIGELRRDERLVTKLWARGVAGFYGDEYHPRTSTNAEGATFERTQRFRSSRRLPVTLRAATEPDDSDMLWVGPQEAEVYASLEKALLRGIVAHPSFSGEDCVRWSGVGDDWDAIAAALEAFVAFGLIEAETS
jgi:hypothetical protein